MKKFLTSKFFIVGVILAILFTAFTIVIKNVGTDAIGPENTTVGLAGINGAVRDLFPYNNLWHKLTKYSGCALFLPPLYFVILFLVQLIRRKSFKKVDREVKLFGVYLLIVLAFYFAFEHLLVINYRPFDLGEGLEPSYPSSHTLFAITMCGSAIALVSRYLKIKHKPLLIVALALLATFNIVGRVLSGVHWATDIMGGLLLGAALLSFLNAFLLAEAEKD